MRIVCCCCSKQIVKYNCHPNDKRITSGPGVRMCGNDWCCNECSKDLDENGLFPEENMEDWKKDE